MRRSTNKLFLMLIALALAGGGFYYYKTSNNPKPEELYRFQEVTRGDIEQSVSANGTLNPVTLISVGTQVSGRVSKLYVDYNDKVEKGQKLLELDDSLFTAQIAQSLGNVNNAQASLELAQANEARTRSLLEQEYVSRQELDQAVQALKSARAQLETARGQLSRDQTNLQYSIIRSPVSGIVIARLVDVGQTVAASFQTPELIKIAQDLSKMQIDSSFAEADIGNIKVGQRVKFNVDAFPNRNFEGAVKQLRLNPTVTSNVVTYDVVVSVDNPEQILLPGMTAYVNITVAKRPDVMLVPNAALRFKPKQEDLQTDKNNRPSGLADGRKKTGQENLSAGKVYVLSTGQLKPIRVSVGISDGRFSEISSDKLRVGDKVVIGETQPDASQPSAQGGMRIRMF